MVKFEKNFLKLIEPSISLRQKLKIKKPQPIKNNFFETDLANGTKTINPTIRRIKQ